MQGAWLVEAPGSAPKRIQLPALSGHLAAVKEGKWLNLMIGRKRPVHEPVASGINVAVEIAADLNTLLPLYLNKEEG